MNRKIYVRFSVLFFTVSIAVFVYTLSLTGLFDKNKILVKALACDGCASYQVVIGSFKLGSHMPDSIHYKNISQVFLNGVPNPYAFDYTKTYDYYVVTGKVTGVNRATVNERWSPVVTVSAWKHIYISSAWPLFILIIILLVVSLYFHRKYVNANKISVLRSSLMTHEETED